MSLSYRELLALNEQQLEKMGVTKVTFWSFLVETTKMPFSHDKGDHLDLFNQNYKKLAFPGGTEKDCSLSDAIARKTSDSRRN